MWRSADTLSSYSDIYEAGLVMQINPMILSDARILAAYVIFFASYFVFALGKIPGAEG